MILLCAATESEVAATKKFLSDNGWDDRVRVLITGVGLLQATYSITKAVCTERPSLILQAGVAGCFDQMEDLGTTVIIEREMVGDLGVHEGGNFRSVTAMGFMKPDAHPWKGGWLVNEGRELQQFPLPKVPAVTINEITTDTNRIDHYVQLGAVAESMEGAALHYVALSERIPFLQLRSFSNYIGERNKDYWQLNAAIESLNRETISILKQLDTV